MPASISRRRMNHGVGAVASRSVTRRSTNREQACSSSMCTGTTSPSPGGTSSMAGSISGTSSAHASSLARPRTEKQKPRSGVGVTSSTVSSRPSRSTASVPGAAVPGGSTRMPLWSSPMPSSLAEQIMPLLTWP